MMASLMWKYREDLVDEFVLVGCVLYLAEFSKGRAVFSVSTTLVTLWSRDRVGWQVVDTYDCGSGEQSQELCLFSRY